MEPIQNPNHADSPRESAHSTPEPRLEASAQRPLIVMVLRTDLVVPDWNPRKFLEEGPLQVLTDYIAKGGPVPRILVWKGNGVSPFAVISGQRRLEAYKRLGREQLEVEILDITLEEAMIMANTSNDNETLFWLDRYEGWERLKREQVWDQATLAAKLGKSTAIVNKAIRTLRVLNANSRQLIRETLPEPGNGGGQKGPKSIPPIYPVNRVHDFKPISEGVGLDPDDNIEPSIITGKLALRLAAFLTNPESKNDDRDAQAQAEKVLPIMIARGLTGAQTGQLVEWLKNGNVPETFQVPVKSPKVKRVKSEGHGQAKDNPQPEVARSRAGSQPFPDGDRKDQAQVGQPNAETGVVSANDGKVSPLDNIRQKVRAGENPKTSEHLALVGHFAGKAVHWIWKHAFRLGKEVLHLVWRLTRDALKTLALVLGRTFYKVTRIALAILFLALLVWVGYESLFHPGTVNGKLKGIALWPVHWVERKLTAENPKPVEAIASNPKTSEDKGTASSPITATTIETQSLQSTAKANNGLNQQIANQNTANEPPKTSALKPKAEGQILNVPNKSPQGIPEKRIDTKSSPSKSPATATDSEVSKVSTQTVPASKKDDAVAKAVGEVAGGLAKKLLGF